MPFIVLLCSSSLCGKSLPADCCTGARIPAARPSWPSRPDRGAPPLSKHSSSFADEPAGKPGDGATEPAWRALLAAAGRTGEYGSTNHDEAAHGLDSDDVEAAAYALDSAGGLRRVARDSDKAWLLRRPGTGWWPSDHAPPPTRALFDLYLPLCNVSADRPLTVAHLGQSLDGFIATETGDSHYVTGRGNILHLHRMRALCDAVVVGAETVSADDPRLTTRFAAGPSPARVILDPQRRLSVNHQVFSDALAPTLLICDAQHLGGAQSFGRAEVVGIPSIAGQLALDVLLNTLRERGLYSVFIEGGGNTVSRFLQAGLLDRLQIAVAPLITGAGRPGLQLPPRQQLSDALRPAHRIFRMGADVLFDCDLRAEPAGANASVLTRIV
jgi:diaminohydroxyphosphoribosylaminopyrimidine deaminase / 5-amino-6-(5-phosphoribosylamino)uracil reductase